MQEDRTLPFLKQEKHHPVTYIDEERVDDVDQEGILIAEALRQNLAVHPIVLQYRWREGVQRMRQVTSSERLGAWVCG